MGKIILDTTQSSWEDFEYFTRLNYIYIYNVPAIFE